jgi:hypothetical protein
VTRVSGVQDQPDLKLKSTPYRGCSCVKPVEV